MIIVRSQRCKITRKMRFHSKTIKIKIFSTHLSQNLKNNMVGYMKINFNTNVGFTQHIYRYY